MKRAFGSEPVLLRSSPVTNAPAAIPAARRPRRKLSRRTIGIAAVCIIAVVTAGLAAVAGNRSTADTVIPSAVRQELDFQVYEPGRLPDRFVLDRKSIQASAGVLTFAYTYDGAKKLIFTEQAAPDSFDFAAFHKQFENYRALSTPVGSGATGFFEDADTASVVAGSTWLLVRAPDGIDDRELQNVVGSLHP